MKKIAIVTRNMFGGGAERVIAELINYFYSINIECLLITINKGDIFYDLPTEIKLIEIGEKSPNKLIDKFLKYREVRKIIKWNKPEIVLSMPEDIGIYVIPSLLFLGIPLVISERNNPWVMPDRKITRFLRRVFYPYADGFIFQTDMAASFFNKKIQKKSITLSNPLDIRRVPKPYIGERKKEVVAAGRLTEQKNFKLLIEAFSEFYKKNNDYKLIIYGEGKLRSELLDMANKLIPPEAFSLPGKTSNLLEKINRSAMFVLSSDYEGLPNVLIEAMVMGMPVIATDCPSGGPKSLIVNKENGIIVPVGDVNALVNAMEKLTNESYNKVLGNNAFALREKLRGNVIYEEWLNYLIKVEKEFRR